MPDKYVVHAFDFDGTITNKDTFLYFIRFCNGAFKFVLGFIMNIHYIIGMLLHLIETQKAKEKIFSSFFKGITIQEFNEKCLAFAKRKKSLLKIEAIDYINSIPENEKKMIVTASIQNYVSCFFDDYDIIIEGTKVETDENGYLTGKFIGKNCKGKEKLKRIFNHFPNRKEYKLIAYGDSSGDKEMLEEADEANFKPFRNRNTHKEFLRYIIVGALAVATQYAVYRFLLQFSSITISHTLSYLMSLTVNFIANSLFTFSVKPTLKKILGFIFSHVINYTMQTIFLHIFYRLGFASAIAPIPAYIICIPFTFVLVRYFMRK